MIRPTPYWTACLLATALGALCLASGKPSRAAPRPGELWNWFYLLDMKTGALREVANGPAGYAPHVRWAPDGRRLILQKRTDDTAEFWELDPSTRRETRLTNLAGVNGGLSYSPDGRWIAFRRDVDIWVMRADGSEQRQLTHDPESAMGPIWSPDGRRIAFTSARDGGVPQIYVMDADGKHLKQLTTDAAGGAGATWSHDGRRIAYVSFQEGWRDLSVIDLPQLTRKRITRGPDIETYAAWSRDDRKLLVTRHPPGTPLEAEIYIVDADGGGEVGLSKAPSNDRALCWSPDNRRIYLTRNWELWVMDADGSHPQPIARQIGSGGYWVQRPSPDRQQLIVGRTAYR